jgi:1-acyl-sn-glycerol-3-phosphate acyltransferase
VRRGGDLNGWWRLGVAVVGPIARVAFRIRVLGAEHVPTRGPALVASNHVSVLDGVALAYVVAREWSRMTRFLVAAEFFEKRPYGWALRLYRQIPILRGRRDEGALDEAIRTVRGGALAGIFPEGRVNPHPEGPLQPGRTGVARLAIAAEVPVVPVGIWGTQRRWPRGRLRWTRPWRPSLAVAFGPSVASEGDPSSPEATRAVTDRVMDAIADAVALARTASGDARG